MSTDRQRTGNSGGLFYGIGAYGLWGTFPAFFVMLKPATPVELLAHRVVWTMVFMAGVLLVTRRMGDLRAISRSTWRLLACASALISLNWLIFVYAINSDHVVDAALGYFINPLVNVLLGVVIFGERLNRAQMFAVALAAVAVITLSAGIGGSPLIGLGLAVSFGLYGAVKKVVPTDPRISVAVESAIAAPFAIIFIVILQFFGDGNFTNHGPGHFALIILCGPVTAIPLLLFAAAAQRVTLVTLGLLQYMSPSLQMIWGIVVRDEPMPPARWLGFILIWVALAIFSADAVSRAYRGRAGKLLS